ncbi:MAG: CARDB domain-containing protein, partial [Thermoplasmata archaeon]
GNASVEMWASSLSVIVDETVTLYINVTSWTLSSNNMIGVFLLRALTAGDTDVPSTDGWRITTDPNGNKHNYVQTTVSGPGDMASFRWDLRAPFSSGTYSLFARVHYGGGNAYWVENTTGLTFDVAPDVSVKPDLVLVDAFTASDSQEGDQVVLYATIFNDFTADLNGISVSFEIDGVAVAEVDNMTVTGKGIRNATATWTTTDSGNFTLTALVDPQNDIDESNESNNELEYMFLVSEPEPEPVPRFEILGLLLVALVVFIVSVVVISLLRREEEDEED